MEIKSGQIWKFKNKEAKNRDTDAIKIHSINKNNIKFTLTKTINK